MTLADELKTLQELYDQGKLTAQEFADAKVATLSKHQAAAPATPPAPATVPVPKAVPHRLLPGWAARLLLVLLIVGGFIWYRIGTQNTSRIVATVVHVPITLEDEVQNLPANSWKTIGLNLPYSGSLSVNVSVVRGNPIDVFLTTPDQIEAMKREDWNNVKVFGDFDASKTRTLQRTARLDEGSYELVMRDTSLGILSSAASDISIKVQLNP